MKNLTITSLLFLFPLLLFAQQPAKFYTPNNFSYPTLAGYGIGIDVDKPNARLHINDRSIDKAALRIDMQRHLIPSGGNNYGLSLFAIKANTVGESGTKITTVFTVDKSGKISSGLSATKNNDQVSIQGPLTVYQGSNFSVGLSATSNLKPELTWRAHQSGNFRFRNINTNKTVMTLTQNGRVGINTEDFFDDHDLYVDGSVYIKDDGEEAHSLYIEGSSVAEEMYVKIKQEWPDYVFSENYTLLPLKDVESFISANGHLPEMPTAGRRFENRRNDTASNSKG